MADAEGSDAGVCEARGVLKRVVIKNPAQRFDDYACKVPESWTVGELKELLSREYEGQPAACEQKVIYGGKILSDAQVLRDFLVSPAEKAEGGDGSAGVEGEGEGEEELQTATMHLVVQSFMCSPTTPPSADLRQAGTGRAEASPSSPSSSGATAAAPTTTTATPSNGLTRLGPGTSEHEGGAPLGLRNLAGSSVAEVSEVAPPGGRPSQEEAQGEGRRTDPASEVSNTPRAHPPLQPQPQPQPQAQPLAPSTPATPAAQPEAMATATTPAPHNAAAYASPPPPLAQQQQQQQQGMGSPALATAYEAALRAIVGNSQTPGGPTEGASASQQMPAAGSSSPFPPYMYPPSPYSPYPAVSPYGFYPPPPPFYGAMDPSSAMGAGGGGHQSMPQQPQQQQHMPPYQMHYAGMMPGLYMPFHQMQPLPTHAYYNYYYHGQGGMPGMAMAGGVAPFPGHGPGAIRGEAAAGGSGANDARNNSNNNNQAGGGAGNENQARGRNDNNNGNGNGLNIWNHVNVQLTLKLFLLGVLINQDGSAGRLALTGFIFFFVYMQQMGIFSANGPLIQKFCALYSHVFRVIDGDAAGGSQGQGNGANGGTGGSQRRRRVNPVVRLFVEVQWFFIALVASLLPSFSPESFALQQQQRARPHQD